MSEVSLNFKYKFPEDYNPIYTNGVFGGSTPKSEIIMNFFLERQPIPYSEIRKVNEKGELIGTPLITREEEEALKIVRYVSTGVVMNLETAKAIHEWLGQHIQHLENERRG